MIYFKQLQNRINELNSKRDKKGYFIGTDKEMDELMNLSLYKRENLAHALVLDFKTDVFRLNSTECLLKIDGIPCSFELEFNPEDTRSYNFNALGIVKKTDGELYKIFNVRCLDKDCCDCYFIDLDMALAA